MENRENAQTRETTADIILQELHDEENNSTFIKEYLKADFLSSAIDALFYARRQSNFTQTQVAEQLKTKQAAIARLEADTNGSLSLRRYVDFALACNMVPLNITLAPINLVRDFVKDNPDISLTEENYNSWRQRKALLTPTFQRASEHLLPVEAFINKINLINTTFVNQKGLSEKKVENRYVQYSHPTEQTLQQGYRGGIINTAMISQVPDDTQTVNSFSLSASSLVNKVAA